MYCGANVKIVGEATPIPATLEEYKLKPLPDAQCDIRLVHLSHANVIFSLELAHKLWSNMVLK
jgi:hypothetical protein